MYVSKIIFKDRREHIGPVDKTRNIRIFKVNIPEEVAHHMFKGITIMNPLFRLILKGTNGAFSSYWCFGLLIGAIYI